MTNEEQNSAMGYTECADIPSAPFPQNPQVSAVPDKCGNPFREWLNDEGDHCMEWPIEDISYLENRLGWAFEAGRKQADKDLRAKLAAAEVIIAQLKHAMVNGTNLAAGIGWDGEKPDIQVVREHLAASEKRCMVLLEENKRLWNIAHDALH